jgi:hypothetical protein
VIPPVLGFRRPGTIHGDVVKRRRTIRGSVSQTPEVVR